MYNNSKIYKIESLNGEVGDIYIGSSKKQYLSSRLAEHKCLYKRWLDGKGNKCTSFKIFEKYGVDNVKIKLIENVNVNVKEELLNRESYFIQSLACINKNIPNRTKKEWREDNKEVIKEYHKKYYLNKKSS